MRVPALEVKVEPSLPPRSAPLGTNPKAVRSSEKIDRSQESSTPVGWTIRCGLAMNAIDGQLGRARRTIRRQRVRLSTLKTRISAAAAAVVSSAAMLAAPIAHAAWEPTKPVEFVVPAGTGGGADQMARLIQGVVVKHKLMKESLIVVNKSGGAGAEGFLSVKDAKGDPHKLIITLS